MYLLKSLIDGLEIMGFEKETIKRVSKEKSLEEIFLSTLFLNYLIVLVIYIIAISLGTFKIEGREINMQVLFGLLMIYPFVYNLVVYGVYGIFGFFAELLDNKKKIKPLISVGFHIAFVFTIIAYLISFVATLSLSFAFFLVLFFVIYFLYSMFSAISTIYEFSLEKTLIIVFLPFLTICILLLLVFILIPNLSNNILGLILN